MESTEVRPAPEPLDKPAFCGGETRPYADGPDMMGATDVPPAPEASDKPAFCGIAVQTLPSGPNYPSENYQRMAVAALYGAQKSVIITTPYFIPDDAFLQAMQTAALRGVHVDLIVPRRSDQVMVGAASRAYYDDLLDAGVRLHLYHDGLLHAKTICIDDSIAFIGSSNCDIRSFVLMFEIDMLFYGADVTRQLRAQQERYIQRSTRLTVEQWGRRPLPNRILQNVAKLLSPLL